MKLEYRLEWSKILS